MTRSDTTDALSRPLRNLRLSVTDRCNLRCAYCMPEETYSYLPSREILSFEEVVSLVDRFIALGVRKVRLTGGEPLVRRDLPTLVQLLAQRGLDDLALTTNGVLLDDLAPALKAAGLHRLTVSLDTLSRARFLSLTRTDRHAAVLRGIAKARDIGFKLKIDTVLIRGINDDELFTLLGFANQMGAELRFIEYMDVGGATGWSADRVVSRSQILERLRRGLGPIEHIVERSSAPAERFRLADGQVFGIIASTTQPFCRSCDRVRLTADGHLFTCLYAADGVDLKGPLRASESPQQLEARLRELWWHRNDRGAEERLALDSFRGPSKSRQELKALPHLEMHARGG